MKIILYSWFILNLYLVSCSLQAETYSIPGAKLKPVENVPISELNGCFFGVRYLGIEPPNDAIIIEVELLLYNQSSQTEDALIKIEKNKIFNLPVSLFNQNITVSSGFSSFNIIPDSVVFLEPKEFLNMYTELFSEDLAVCGIRVHYLPDLIFKNGF